MICFSADLFAKLVEMLREQDNHEAIIEHQRLCFVIYAECARCFNSHTIHSIVTIQRILSSLFSFPTPITFRKRSAYYQWRLTSVRGSVSPVEHSDKYSFPIRPGATRYGNNQSTTRYTKTFSIDLLHTCIGTTILGLVSTNNIRGCAY